MNIMAWAWVGVKGMDLGTKIAALPVLMSVKSSAMVAVALIRILLSTRRIARTKMVPALIPHAGARLAQDTLALV